MTDLPYATTRKPNNIKQHRTLSYNIQSSLMRQQLNPYNNTTIALTSRKTPSSKRYMMNMNTNQTQLNNKTIDFQALRMRQKTLSVTKQNEFMPLPEIQVAKNKRGAKKGSYLQIWLNQALDQGHGNQNFLTNFNDQTLGSLKKYGIDRKILKAKSISQQTIDKIYKKLYIYSKGLGMTFEQISKLAQIKSPVESQSTSFQSDGNQIVEIFWRVFSKLIEHQTPFESAFRVMERKYLKTIEQMRYKLQNVGEEITLMQIKHEQEKKKLSREIQMLQVKYQQLQNEFTVNKSTLQLTNESLDTEIDLRLKFQAKINSVYTSYNDMKTKYALMMEELGVKKEINVQQQQEENKLKERLENAEIKCKQLEYLLELQQAKVRDLRAELVIKNEQKNDLEKEMLTTQQNANKQSDIITQYMQKNKHLSALISERQIEMTLMKNVLSQQKQVNSKLSKRISALSDFNSKLYEQKFKLFQLTNQLKENNCVLTNQAKVKQEQIQKLMNEINSVKDQLSAVSNELMHEKSTSRETQSQLQIKTTLLTKANQNITKMKDIKDRHQRLHALSEHEKNQVIDSNTSLMVKLQQMQVQIQNLSNELVEKQQLLAVQMTNSKNQKQLLTKNVRSLQEQINKKDQTILRYMNTNQTEGIRLMKKQRELNDVKEKLQTKQSLIYNMESKNVLLATNQPLIEELLRKKEQQLKLEVEKNIVNLVTQNQLKSKIQGTEILLHKLSTETHLQTESYKRLAQSYREMHEKRKDFVHPMVHQDVLGCIARAERRVNKLKETIQQMHRQNEGLRLQLQETKETNSKLKDCIDRLHGQITSLKSTINNLQSQNTTLSNELRQQMDKSFLMIQHQKKQASKIVVLTNEKISLQKQIHNKTVEMYSLTQKVSELGNRVQQLEQVNEEIQRRYRQSEKAFELFRESNAPKITCHKYAQTDNVRTNTTNPSQVSIPTQNVHHKSYKLVQNQLPSINKILQIKQQNLSSRQITQNLIEHSAQQAVQFKKYEQIIFNQTQRQIEKQIQKQIFHKEQKLIIPVEKKKVEKNQFKRALRLTYMRR